MVDVQDVSVRLIVGLGNPGESYRQHRHNLGFLVVEELAMRLGLVFRPGGSSYLVAGAVGGRSRLFLLKPMTYMNLSGQAIDDWSRDCGVAVTGMAYPDQQGTLADISAVSGAVRPLVVCDDLNLPLGSVRLRPRGSSGGQNGLASAIDQLGGEEFPRLRLGIAPLDRQIAPEVWPDHVLADFTPEEQPSADQLVSTAAAALEYWLDHGLEPAISRFNQRVRLDPEPED